MSGTWRDEVETNRETDNFPTYNEEDGFDYDDEEGFDDDDYEYDDEEMWDCQEYRRDAALNQNDEDHFKALEEGLLGEAPF